MRQRVVAAGCGLALGLGSVIAAGATSPPRPGTAAQVRALVAASVHIDKLTKVVAAQVQIASTENTDQVYGVPFNCVRSPRCDFGDKSSSSVVVLFGDSYVRQWLPALLPLASARHFKIVIVGEDGCPIISTPLAGTFSGCLKITSAAIKSIVAMKPRAIIVSERSSWLLSITHAQWQKGLTTTLQRLRAAKAPIAMFGDIQIFPGEIITCLAINSDHVQHCSVPNPNPHAPNHASAQVAAAATAKVHFINPTAWLCTATRCSPVIGSYVAYWDSFHISVPYAKYLAVVAAQSLASTLKGVTG
jgi:hypothetical protein